MRVSAAGHMTWLRRSPLVLACGVWLVVCQGEARSAGCHAAERPTLGLSLSWEPETTVPTAEVIPPRLVKTPCSAEMPNTPTRTSPSPPGLALAVPPPLETTGVRLADSPLSLLAQIRPSRLDRPPRGLTPVGLF
jgi:hypothetical protein